MTADQVIDIFERLNIEGRVNTEADLACAGFAGWLARAWGRLNADEIALLTSVGAVLWMEGFKKRA